MAQESKRRDPVLGLNNSADGTEENCMDMIRDGVEGSSYLVCRPACNKPYDGEAFGAGNAAEKVGNPELMKGAEALVESVDNDEDRGTRERAPRSIIVIGSGGREAWLDDQLLYLVLERPVED